MHHPTSTMSSSFHTHGLIGIDLHHAQERRATQLTSQVHHRSVWNGMRDSLSNLLIAAGALLAGKEAGSATESQPAV